MSNVDVEVDAAPISRRPAPRAGILGVTADRP
jgi:hypothetical protein